MSKKTGKPFYFRLEPMQLLSELIQIPEAERGAWITKVAVELASGVPTTDFAHSLFNEASEFKQAASERSRIAGLASAAKRQHKSTDVEQTLAPVEHELNECQPSNSSSNRTKEKPLKTSSPDALRLAEKLADLILENNPSGSINLLNGKKAATVQKWSSEIEKLNRLDKQDWAAIEKVIEWCQQDNFWKGNILSADKLRQQWPKLTAKMVTSPAGKIDDRQGYVFGRDPKPEIGTPDYKLWKEAYAAHCN